MKIEFRIPDMSLEIIISGGSTQFFDMLELAEKLIHYLRTKKWEEVKSEG